jgi:hypothetical protein
MAALFFEFPESFQQLRHPTVALNLIKDYLA